MCQSYQTSQTCQISFGSFGFFGTFGSFDFLRFARKWFSLAARSPDSQSRSGVPVAAVSATRLGHRSVFDCGGL
jgi:hypothetical protein